MVENAEVLACAISGHSSMKTNEEAKVELRTKEADLMNKYVSILNTLQGSEQFLY